MCHLHPGPPPVYIGFGSLVVNNPEQLTQCFISAVTNTGLRAIIQRGWGSLGAGIQEGEQLENVCFIDAAPHDWLFDKVSAVVHHGGAGTTAAGLYAGVCVCDKFVTSVGASQCSGHSTSSVCGKHLFHLTGLAGVFC